MKRLVERKRPKNKGELLTAILSSWENISERYTKLHRQSPKEN